MKSRGLAGNTLRRAVKVQWLASRTLRARLIAGLLLLFAVASIGVGLVTTIAFRDFQIRQLDQQLFGAAQALSTAIEGSRFENAPLGPAGCPGGASGDDGRALTNGQAVGTYAARFKGGQLSYSCEIVDTNGRISLATVPLSGADLAALSRITSTAAKVAELPLASGHVELPHRVPDADPRTEVGQLSEAFNRMLGHVEQSLSQRQASEARLRQFIADASHELRTPLAGIRGYTELALRTSGPVDPGLHHALRRVDSESGRMSRLVDDLLLLARLDAGRPLAHEAVDLTRLAIDATNDARVAGPQHRWLLDLPDEPVIVAGDQYRLHQVLANLLTNARVHTPPGTTVTVRLIPASPAGQSGGVELTVSDDGPGIPPELQDSVWERFARGDSARSHKAGSTGLGLAIVAAVVTAHQGQASVASRPGKTTFRIWLPRRAP